jgi:phthalate 4,5-dioxygenase
MLTPQENERLTKVGPETPMGRTLRRYWMPAALGSELQADCPPVRVRILGEDLVAFRDAGGKVGLVDGYPTWEGAGLIWAYLGPPSEMPPPPDYELVRAPATHRHVSKTFEDCNWLQSLEGGLDTAHSSFAHNMNIKDRTFVRNADRAPRLEVEKTDYGFRYAGIRTVRGDQYVRVYHYLMPAQQCRGGVTADQGGLRNPPAIHGHIWVPIDDTHTNVYNWIYSYDPAIPITDEFATSYEIHAGRGPEDYVPGTFRLKKTLANDYLIDRQVQKTQTFTGIVGINTQDFALQEGMGPIVDRSKEHHGTTDRAIIVTRQLLLEATYAVERGERPRGTDTTQCRTVRAVDLIVPKDAEWREALREEMLAKF